jgi:ADP-glucose pyrophosphorylase
MESSSFISPDAQITNSKLGVNIKIYKNVTIRNSSLNEVVTIGESTDLIDCNIDSNVSINRRNYLLRTDIGHFCYTGIGTQ